MASNHPRGYWTRERVVDEAHKFRSHTTNAFEALQAICKMPRIETGNIPGYKKKVMLISATPMNNTPADIYNEILLFQDPRRCTIDGIPNLTNFFAPLIAEFKKQKAKESPDLMEFKKLAEKVRDRVIKPLTIRRTRHDIESVERYSKDVAGFPKVEKPVKKEYELNEHLADLFEKAMDDLVNHLTYARYQAIAYLLPEKSNGLYDNAETISRSLANIRKNGLVKRLESSFEAFKTSLDRFRSANQNLIDMFANDKDLKEQEAKILADKAAEEERLRQLRESEEEKERKAKEAERKRQERERKKNNFFNRVKKGFDSLSGELFGSEDTSDTMN